MKKIYLPDETISISDITLTIYKKEEIEITCDISFNATILPLSKKEYNKANSNLEGIENNFSKKVELLAKKLLNEIKKEIINKSK